MRTTAELFVLVPSHLKQDERAALETRVIFIFIFIIVNIFSFYFSLSSFLGLTQTVFAFPRILRIVC
jgi:hypothetical protein